MEITIKTKATNNIEKSTYLVNLQKIADNLTRENIAFIAELSEKKDINKKLVDKKILIKSFV